MAEDQLEAAVIDGGLLAADNLFVALVTLVVMVLAVLLHHEVLNTLYHRLPALGERTRLRMLLLLLTTMTVHTVEIWLFGGAYWFLLGQGMGRLTTNTEPDLFDLLYFSASTYTTAGYGDVVVEGPVRILAGTEALMGLVLITWSASFTYSELRRSWDD